MSKRLQVLLDDEEYEHLQTLARRRNATVSDLVRVALRKAAREEPTSDPDRKLAVVRLAAQGDFPAPDIEVMLREIEQGYSPGGNE